MDFIRGKNRSMKKRGRKGPFWLSLTPWAVLGGLVVLAPVALFLASSSIRRDRENMTQLLVEKGAALIRSFEAGARTGMMGMGWGGNQVQRLLVETVKQPDILYLVVTDQKGIALAHSSPRLIHKLHPTATVATLERSNAVHWRRVETITGPPVFEVYKQFRPTSGMPFPFFMQRKPRGSLQEKGNPGPGSRVCPPGTNALDWCQPFLDPNGRKGGPAHYIFVGLDIGTLESSRVEARRHTLVMTAGLLLIGFAGMVSLFMAQGYKLARRSLAKVRAFSDQVMESLPVGLVASDEKGRIGACNEAAEVILSTSEENILDKKAETILPRELWGLTERLHDTNMIIEQDIECHVSPIGTLPLRVSVAVLREDDGLFLGYVFIFRDLTEVRRLQQELERSRRLASLGNLAAGVAHEIRNPLSSIKGFATYFREIFKDRPAERDTAAIMIQEVERLDRVIGQLLEFARPSSLKIISVNLKDLISHSLRLIESDARTKGIEVKADVPSDLPPV